jgi:hypothetical protein
MTHPKVVPRLPFLQTRVDQTLFKSQSTDADGNANGRIDYLGEFQGIPVASSLMEFSFAFAGAGYLYAGWYFAALFGPLGFAALGARLFIGLGVALLGLLGETITADRMNAVYQLQKRSASAMILGAAGSGYRLDRNAHGLSLYSDIIVTVASGAGYREFELLGYVGAPAAASGVAEESKSHPVSWVATNTDLDHSEILCGAVAEDFVIPNLYRADWLFGGLKPW